MIKYKHNMWINYYQLLLLQPNLSINKTY